MSILFALMALLSAPNSTQAIKDCVLQDPLAHISYTSIFIGVDTPTCFAGWEYGFDDAEGWVVGTYLSDTVITNVDGDDN